MAFASARGMDETKLANCATKFLAFRIGYTLTYIGGVNQVIAAARSGFWFMSFVVCIKIFAEAAKQK